MSQSGGIGGGAGAPLANLFVQFSQQGAEALEKAIEFIADELKQLKNSLSVLSEEINVSFSLLASDLDKLDKELKIIADDAKKLGDIFKNLSLQINIALSGLLSLIIGLVTQGLHLSALGDALRLAFQRLALVFSGLFRPELQKILALIRQLTNYLANLTDAQREQLVLWIKGAAAALAFGLVLPKVIAGVRALSIAITSGLVGSGFGALLPLLGLAAQALAFWMTATVEGQQAAADLWAALKDLLELFKDFFKTIGQEAVSSLQLLIELLKRTAAALRDVSAAMKELGFGEGLSAFAKDVFFKMFPLAKLAGDLKKAFLQDKGAASVGSKPGGDVSRAPDIATGAHMEDLTKTWERIAMASIGTVDTGQETVDWLEKIWMQVSAILGVAGNIVPPLTNNP